MLGQLRFSSNLGRQAWPANDEDGRDNMINHILIPLYGSTLAEFVLPHVPIIAKGADTRITLSGYRLLTH